MINTEKIKSILDGYVDYFPEHWNDETYKWQAVKCFQDNWNTEAENFKEMFIAATEKASNLLTSANFYPRTMIINFAHADAEATRAMFRKLFDESISLQERVSEFQVESEKLRVKLDDEKWKNHYQNTNAISTYLWLRYPDKYYIYKYEIASSVAKELDSDHQPKANGSAQSMIEGFHLYDDICEVVKNDDRTPLIGKDVFYNPMQNGDKSNDNSLVKLFRVGSFQVLSLGDCEDSAIANRLMENDILKGEVDIMILAHHGADNGFTTKEFLEAIRPKVCVCSSDYGIKYDHPRDIIRQRCLSLGIPLFTTKRGDIIAQTIDAKHFKVSNYVSNNEAKDTVLSFSNKTWYISDVPA